MTIQIEEWSVVNPAREFVQFKPGTICHLAGFIFGREDIPSDTLQTTSFLRDFRETAGIAITNSGTTYVLGKPHAQYAAWRRTCRGTT